MAYDVTLVNLNLMFATIEGVVDFQAYAPLGLLYIAAVLEPDFPVVRQSDLVDRVYESGPPVQIS